jgi:16S rRNA processing protein RimM
MRESSADSDDWVSVVRFGRPRGLRGEIFGDVWNPPESYGWLKRIWVRRREGEFLLGGGPVAVIEARPFRGRLILRLAGIDSVDSARSLAGCEGVVPRTELPPLPENEFYLSDLTGCAVFDSRTGARVGAVTGWQDFGGAIVLEMEPEGGARGGPVWIPFTRSICVEIRPELGRLVIDPPEGLLELNRPEQAGPEPDDDLPRADHLPGVLPRPVRARRRRQGSQVRPRRNPHP